VILSPSGEVSVCPGEDALFFMCTTNRSFIDWNVTLILESGERISRTRLISSNIQVSVSPLVVKGTSFNITAQAGSLLTSTLTAPEPVSDLNGTEVSCTAIEDSLVDAVTASTTIRVIEGGKYASIFCVRGFVADSMSNLIDTTNAKKRAVLVQYYSSI
jgi:hypothetical protein